MLYIRHLAACFIFIVVGIVFDKFGLMDESAAKAAKLEPFDYSPGRTRSWNEWFERLLELFGDTIISFARSRTLPTEGYY